MWGLLLNSLKVFSFAFTRNLLLGIESWNSLGSAAAVPICFAEAPWHRNTHKGSKRLELNLCTLRKFESLLSVISALRMFTENTFISWFPYHWCCKTKQIAGEKRKQKKRGVFELENREKNWDMSVQSMLSPFLISFKLISKDFMVSPFFMHTPTLSQVALNLVPVTVKKFHVIVYWFWLFY